MELMDKMDKMLAENERYHFEMDVKTLQDIEDRKREVDLQAHQRLMKIQKQRSLKGEFKNEVLHSYKLNVLYWHLWKNLYHP